MFKLQKQKLLHHRKYNLLPAEDGEGRYCRLRSAVARRHVFRALGINAGDGHNASVSI